MNAKVKATPTTRRPRNQMSDFGVALKSFVIGVHATKLALKVKETLGWEDTDKTDAAIKAMVRTANITNGILSVRRKPLAEAVIKGVVELDPDLAAKGTRLAASLQYEAASSRNRDSANNWIVKLKAGEEVKVSDGPEGDGMYKLVFVRPFDPDIDDDAVEPAVEEGASEEVLTEEAVAEPVADEPAAIL
jgi:hypothetical protein